MTMVLTNLTWTAVQRLHRHRLHRQPGGLCGVLQIIIPFKTANNKMVGFKVKQPLIPVNVQAVFILTKLLGT